jgi:hypothetical protein
MCVDVTAGRLDRGTDALRERAERLVEIARLGGDSAQIHDLAEDARAPLQPFAQLRAREHPRQHLSRALQEAEVLGVVALTRVVDVDETKQLVVDDERHAHLAGVAVLAVDLPFALTELRVVRAGDDQRLMAVHRRHDGGIAHEVEKVTDGAFVVATAVEARHTSQAVIGHAEDVAAGCVDGRPQAPGSVPHQAVQASGVAAEVTKLHELVEDPAAPPGLLEEGAVLEGAGGRRTQPANELKIRVELPRYVVRKLDEADHAPSRDQRHGQLRPVAPLLERVAGLLAEQFIIKARHSHHLPGIDGAATGRIAKERDHDVLPLEVETATVVACERPKRVVLDRVDVDDRGAGDLGEPLGDSAEHFVGALLCISVKVGLQDLSQVSIASPQLGRRVGAAEDRGQKVGRDSDRHEVGRRASGRAAPELEKADDGVPINERREEDLGETPRGQESRGGLGRERSVIAAGYRDDVAARCRQLRRRVLVELPSVRS